MTESYELEQTVQTMLPILRDHFIQIAKKNFRAKIEDFEFTATQTTERAGVSGRVLISNVYYKTEHGENFETIAMKFFQNTNSAITEIRNAMELEIKFRAAPEFGIPKVIFASTKDPVLIIYEGINATNYDEINIARKAWQAGRLLATIHGGEARPVDNTLYRDLSRMIGSQLAKTGYEKVISDGLGFFYERIEKAYSGCDPFSDFHQSNVMIMSFDDLIGKVYIIDPEFMQKGSFDRLEDVGTFFGFQLFNEFEATNRIDNGIKDVNEFFSGYQSKLHEMGGLSWQQMYPNGCALPFFVAQWALMDALDMVINRGGNLNSPDAITRLNFAKYVLQLENAFQFPKSIL
ncbi:MAG: hypothetical protein HeimC2_06600 [Candidatus Heimdallarchaeota archaeon LC_2]|nr:MAG: hypothetical protein HeimC2_06600 [Candidatus Heimdallarchaeota archaeon LC_2]